MARKSMGLLDAIAWASLAGKRLEGARASNFYYDPESGLLMIKVQGLEGLLVAEGGRRIHVSKRTATPKEYRPYPLVVLLRKRLRGQRISGVGLLGGDRIVRISFPSGHSIVVELLPRGVIALLDPEGRVLASDKTLKARDRVIRPGAEYRPPPAKGSILLRVCSGEDIGPEEVGECVRAGRDLVRGLVRGCGVQGEAAEEALHRAGVDPGSDPSSLSGEALDRVLEALREVCSESSQGRGYLVRRDGVPLEAVPFYPGRYEGEAEIVAMETFDDALDELFSSPRTGPARGEEEADPELARLEASLRRAEERAREYRAEAERLRQLALAVSRAYDRVARILEAASRGETVRVGKVSAEPRGDKVVVLLGDVRVEVPRGAGPERLVVELYKLAGEMESKAERALSVRSEVERRLEELRLRSEARRLAQMAARRRRYWFERFHWTMTRGGLLAIGGRDAGQNEAVVKKYLGPNDIFLHASIHGAPAVVLRTRGREPSEEDLYDAAVLTAAYSRAWKAGAGSVEVYWARADQVSFSPPSGEYLARGGIMVYGRKNYLPRPVPVRIALGIALNEEGVPIVFQGSEETVERATLAYVVLAPGDMGKEEAAEEIRRRLSSVLPREQAPIAYAVRLEEIMPRIPGRARILRARRGRGGGVNMRELAE